MTNLNKETIAKLAQILKSFGYDVYISESGTYGFYRLPDGSKLISFSVSYFWINFSSNHRSNNLGSGHRLTNDEQCLLWEIDTWATKELFEKLMNCTPYKSRKKNEYFIKWTSLDEHMAFYNSSSKYTKI